MADSSSRKFDPAPGKAEPPAEEPVRTSLIATTAKSVLLVGGISFAAAGWLATVATKDRDTLSRLAANVSTGLQDPLTTGSIGRRAESARLDPCTSRKP